MTERAQRPRGGLWILLVIGLLVGNAVAVAILMVKAGDPTPRVLPDYYKRAVAWDDTMAAERASQELGWRAQPALRGDSGAVALLGVALADRGGAPVAGATITAEVGQQSRADRDVTVTLVEDAPGQYHAEVAAPQRGLYRVQLTAVRGDQRFVSSEVVELSAKGGP